VIRSAVLDSVFPGAVLLVGNSRGIVYEKAYGRYDYSDSAKPTTINTVFDLASLTKVIATTPAAMKLYEERKLPLDSPVAHYIPAFAQNGKARVTIRNLLLHNSGLPAGKPLYRICKSEKEALDSLYAMPLSYETGTRTVYSDLGMIVLGKVIEGITGMPLDAFVRETFYGPLGMRETMFKPPDSLWTRIAPTEIENNSRVTHETGKVHNPITRLMNGVTGHAGLFSSAEDLSKMALMLLNGGVSNGRRYLQQRTITLFTTRQGMKSSRALGWDTRDDNDKSEAGQYFLPAAFGHTGFTGTSIWIDRGKHVFVVLLTNRTYQMRNRNKILVTRPLIHDAVCRDLGIAK
jgi:beta-N-acetylhexosaminidase